VTPLQELLARKALENKQLAQSAAGASVAEQRNIETGMAASVPMNMASMVTLRSYATIPTKELDIPRAMNAIAVYEDLKLRHILRGRGKPFKSENGYFYVENEFDAGLMNGYVNKSIPVVKQVTREFIEEAFAELAETKE
jgi:hypothetical protein